MIETSFDSRILNIKNVTEIVRGKISEFVEQPETGSEELAETIAAYCKHATNGNLRERANFIAFIKTILLKELPLSADFSLRLAEEQEFIDCILPFSNAALLSARDKFEILLFLYNKGTDAADYHQGFRRFRQKNSYIHSVGVTKKGKPKKLWYEYSEKQIHDAYRLEKPELTFSEKLDILAQRIYADAYGLGCIDILAHSNVNEIGLSNDGSYIYCWDGDKIHLSFFSLSEPEMMVIQNRSISFDNKIGQLCAGTPEVCCYRADNARITAMQPPFSSSRNLYIRIFNQSARGFDDIFQDETEKLLIQFLVKSGAKIILQGPLGSGKTTTMQVLLELLGDSLHIGTVEDYFEQHNAVKYKNKRITELQMLPGKSLLDTAMSLFRTSVDVASVGEARDGEAVFTFLQLAQAINQSAFFTCHVATPEDTVPRLKNMLTSTGIYSSEQSAVADIVNYINIIFQHGIDGRERRITKIVEIVPQIEKASCMALSAELAEEDLKRLALLKQIQQDTAYMYRLNPLMEYEHGRYRLKNLPSRRFLEKARENAEAIDCLEQLLKRQDEQCQNSLEQYLAGVEQMAGGEACGKDK